MKRTLILMAVCLAELSSASAQSLMPVNDKSSGTFSLGTRNTISMFNDDDAIGAGIGGQLRIQFSDHFNSEWYFDYITSKSKNFTYRNDYHIGWSLMFYPGKNCQFQNFLQPYFIAGHCFDYSKVTSQKNAAVFADRVSMATQAGLGTHLNITHGFDCSLSCQYMLHFGKEIETVSTDDEVKIEKNNFSTPDGHLLFTISFNYKLGNLW